MENQGTKYTCAACGKAVIVKSNGELVRSCNHTVGVVGSMSAVARGKSKLK